MNVLMAVSILIPGQIKFTADAVDESAGGLACYRIETPAATYYLEKSGAGLSSLVDRDGHDCSAFSRSPAAGPAASSAAFPTLCISKAAASFIPATRAPIRPPPRSSGPTRAA